MLTATTLDPDDPLVLGFSSSDAVRRGDIDEAVAIWRRVVAKDPLSPMYRGNLVGMLLANGQLDEALAENRRVLELHPDAGSRDRVEAVRILILLGRYDEAQSAIDQMPKGENQDDGLALLHRVSGRQAEADAALIRLEAADGDFRTKVYLADVYAFRGMHDEAFALLLETRNALERDKGSQPSSRWYFQDDLRLSPFLKPLHDDPRWSALTAYPR